MKHDQDHKCLSVPKRGDSDRIDNIEIHTSVQVRYSASGYDENTKIQDEPSTAKVQVGSELEGGENIKDEKRTANGEKALLN